MADVFISYKSERRAAANHLGEILAANGYTVWWDYGLAAGTDFAEEIEHQLERAGAVLVLWCSRSRSSKWVVDEANFAAKRQKAVPVRIEMVDAPLGWGPIHTIDLSDWDGDPESHLLKDLIRSVATTTRKAPTELADKLAQLKQRWIDLGRPSLATLPLDRELKPPRSGAPFRKEDDNAEVLRRVQDNQIQFTQIVEIFALIAGTYYGGAVVYAVLQIPSAESVLAFIRSTPIEFITRDESSLRVASYVFAAAAALLGLMLFRFPFPRRNRNRH